MKLTTVLVFVLIGIIAHFSVRMYGEHMLVEGRKELAQDLILACMGEAPPGSDSCVMFFEAVKGRPITITIGEERLYCSQAGSDLSC